MRTTFIDIVARVR